MNIQKSRSFLVTPKAVMDPLHLPPETSDEEWIAEAERLLAEAGYDPQKRKEEKMTEAYRNRLVLRAHQLHKRLKSK